MKTFSSRAVSLGSDAGVASILNTVDSLLHDHGLEVVMVKTDQGTVVMVESMITETVVMETPPTNTLDLSQKQQFKKRLPG